MFGAGLSDARVWLGLRLMVPALASISGLARSGSSQPGLLMTGYGSKIREELDCRF